MDPILPPSPPRYGSHGQRLKTSEELRCSRSIADKKCAVKKFLKWEAPVPPSLAAYAGSSSSGAGSSRRRRRAPSPPSSSSEWDNGDSHYRDYATPDHTNSSKQSDGDRVVARDFVDNDEDEARITAWTKHRSKLARCCEINADQREIDEALRLIKRQKQEAATVERLKKAHEEVVVVPSDDDD